MNIREDFENIREGQKVTLYPNDINPLHKRPVKALFSGGYFFCENSNVAEGPDYYLGDVLMYNDGFSED